MAAVSASPVFVAVVDEDQVCRQAPSLERTPVEEAKLRRRPPGSWRLACQALVDRSVAGPDPSSGVACRDAERRRHGGGPAVLRCRHGPTAWPVVASREDDDEGAGDDEDLQKQSFTGTPANADEEG